MCTTVIWRNAFIIRRTPTSGQKVPIATAEQIFNELCLKETHSNLFPETEGNV